MNEKVFTFIAPNGVEVIAVCLKCLGTTGNITQYLCYAQNRLFILKEYLNSWIDDGETCHSTEWEYEIIVDYCILPDYDAHLENIKRVESFGYNKKEAINILDGKNLDGTQLPF